MRSILFQKFFVETNEKFLSGLPVESNGDSGMLISIVDLIILVKKRFEFFSTNLSLKDKPLYQYFQYFF